MSGECRELDKWFKMSEVDEILNKGDGHEDSEGGDQEKRLKGKERCEGRAPLVARVEKECGWLKLWSNTLEG